MKENRRCSKRKNNFGTLKRSHRRSKKRNNYVVKILVAGSLLTLLYLYKKSLKDTEKNKSNKDTEKNKSNNRESCEQIANNYGYTIKKVDIKGDGSCMFRSISYQIENNQENYQKYRNKAVNYIRSKILTDPKLKENTINNIKQEFQGLDHEKYLKEMLSNRWGDSIILQALSNELNRKIIVINCQPYLQKNEFLPGYWDGKQIRQSVSNENPPIIIGFIHQNHYICLEKL
jgi:hypothetical protein